MRYITQCLGKMQALSNLTFNAAVRQSSKTTLMNFTRCHVARMPQVIRIYGDTFILACDTISQPPSYGFEGHGPAPRSPTRVPEMSSVRWPQARAIPWGGGPGRYPLLSEGGLE